jgi:hypothetical protein
VNQEQLVRALDRQRAQERLRAAIRGRVLLASIDGERRAEVERRVVAGIVQRLTEVLDASHFEEDAYDALDDAACDLDLGPYGDEGEVEQARFYAYDLWIEEMEEKVKDAIRDALEERLGP